MQRIVGDEAAPDQAPQRVDRFAGIAAADGLVERIEEAGARRFKNREQLFFALRQWFDDGARLGEQGQLVGKIQGDAAVAFAERLDAGPGHFTGGDERVETGGLVPCDARGQNRRFEQGSRERGSLEAFDGIEQHIEVGVAAAAGDQQSLPVGEEAGQRVLLHRLDFAAQAGQRLAADLAQNLGVAPLAMQAAGTEASFEHAAFADELAERRCRSLARSSAKRFGDFAKGERAVGAGIAADKFEHRVRDRLQQRDGQTRGKGNAQGVAIAGGVFGGDEAAFAGDAQLKQAAGADQPVYRIEQGRVGDPARELCAGEIAQAEAEVVNAVGGAGAVVFAEALGVLFDLGDDVGVEQFAQVGFARAVRGAGPDRW